MPLLGKKFPTPIARPLWPFFTAGAIILYGVNSAQNAMMNTDEWRNDPRNPAASGTKKSDAH
ncbi:ATP synthase subunit J [Elsinoe fawcettii]|nr:ATP synthase subunit J [Elsinoe fawcettii]